MRELKSTKNGSCCSWWHHDYPELCLFAYLCDNTGIAPTAPTCGLSILLFLDITNFATKSFFYNYKICRSWSYQIFLLEGSKKFSRALFLKQSPSPPFYMIRVMKQPPLPLFYVIHVMKQPPSSPFYMIRVMKQPLSSPFVVSASWSNHHHHHFT